MASLASPLVNRRRQLRQAVKMGSSGTAPTRGPLWTKNACAGWRYKGRQNCPCGDWVYPLLLELAHVVSSSSSMIERRIFRHTSLLSLPSRRHRHFLPTLDMFGKDQHVGAAAALGLARETTSADPYRYLLGFGNHHATEAIPGALPQNGTNLPAKVRFGLYAEHLNGTSFISSRDTVSNV